MVKSVRIDTLSLLFEVRRWLSHKTCIDTVIVTLNKAIKGFSNLPPIPTKPPIFEKMTIDEWIKAKSTQFDKEKIQWVGKLDQRKSIQRLLASIVSARTFACIYTIYN